MNRLTRPSRGRRPTITILVLSGTDCLILLIGRRVAHEPALGGWFLGGAPTRLAMNDAPIPGYRDIWPTRGRLLLILNLPTWHRSSRTWSRCKRRGGATCGRASLESDGEAQGRLTSLRNGHASVRGLFVGEGHDYR